MQPREVITLLLSGGALVVLGLVPGLVEGLEQGIHTFSANLTSSYRPTPPAKASTHPWFAAIGLTLILAGALAAVSH